MCKSLSLISEKDKGDNGGEGFTNMKTVVRGIFLGTLKKHMRSHLKVASLKSPLLTPLNSHM